MKRLQLYWRLSRSGLNPGECHVRTALTVSGARPPGYSMGIGGSFLGLKRSTREANHLAPCSSTSMMSEAVFPLPYTDITSTGHLHFRTGVIFSGSRQRRSERFTV